MHMKVVLQSGGGKDSILALYEFKRAHTDAKVVGALVTITRDFSRVSMHGVREDLIEMQMDALGLKVFKSYIPAGASNEIYIEETLKTLEEIKEFEDIQGIVFGDIFLEDIRKFREELLKPTSLIPIFPIWGRDTRELAMEFIDLGFRAITVVIDRSKLTEEFLCRDFDGEFLQHLPPGIDPMGENGEFHTFVYAGPMFREEIKFKKGKTHNSSNFMYCDLIADRED